MTSRAAVLALWLASGSALALEVPAVTRRVNDQAGVLSSTDQARLEQRLADYERQTGHQFAVLIIPSLQGDPLEDYALRAAEKWRLGDKRRDDGLLVLVSVQDRKARIEVGYGLEGAIPDVLAGRVIREAFAPHFASGNYARGLETGLELLMRAARGENVGPPSRGPVGTGPPPFMFILVLLLFLNAFFGWLPRLLRMPFIGFCGGALGWFFWGILGAVGLGLLGFMVGFVRLSSGMGFGHHHHHHGWRSSGWRSSGGGFSGGGGRFGGGGASGGW
ncbi:MAG: TPM domain-containing protein [Myxococcota bacterium]